MSGETDLRRGGGIRAVVLGPPGSGKGTQAERACRRFGCSRISTGDILRDAIRQGSRLGKRVESLLASGALVPDELVGELVEAKIGGPGAAEGFLLDGFPRTLAQVGILDRVLERTGRNLDAALYLRVEEAEVVRRLGGRRICAACGATFHVEFHPPAHPGRCDACGGELRVRDDDRPVVIRERLRVYRRETAPVADCYRERGILREIPAHGSAEEVWVRFQAAVEGMVS